MPPSPRRSWLSLVLALVVATSHAARADDTTPPGGRAEALQVLADLTLIDGACRDVVVNFGTGFRFAASRGVAVGRLLPGGADRPAFEAALRARRASFAREELCGEIADNYAEALPGSVTPVGRRGDRP